MPPNDLFNEQQQMFEAAIAAAPAYPAERFAGRGIVICAGGERLFTCAWVAIGILRRALHCRLPIQLWHLGPEEIGPPMRALLEAQDVEIIDALEQARRYPLRIAGGWELKSYAIVHSRFREVFLLDADNVPLIDPAALFELPQYAATGAIFWPDAVRLRADNPIWQIAGVAYRSTPSVESGQLLVDKQRCWAALQLAQHMNQHSDFFYQHLYGDKDTFLIAWLRLGQDYAMPAHAPLLRHAVINQRDFDGRIIFQHRNSAKWSYGSANTRIAGFELHDECAALLAELQQVWSGRVFTPPAQSVPARQVEASLRQNEWFTYLKVGGGEKSLQLLSDNQIGEGQADNEFYWWVEEDGEGLLLGFEGRRHTGARLRPMADGSWLGRSLEPEAWEVQLTPRAAAAGDPPIASAMALLESILASPAGKPDSQAAVDALGATLNVLRQAVPGFSKALADYLAGYTAGPRGDRGEDEAGDETIRCLRAALAAPSIPTAPRRNAEAGPTPHWFFNLGTHYER
jgi:hypothetical protein